MRLRRSKRLELQAVDQPGPQEHALEQRRPLAGGGKLRAHGVRRQPAVERAFEDELDESLEVELVGRHAQHHARRRRGRVAHRAAVTRGAVHPDVVEAEPPAARDADRQLVARLNREPERLVAAADAVRANGRQRTEHPVGRQHAADGAEQRDAWFAADRSVLEMLFDVVECDRPIDAQRYDHPRDRRCGDRERPSSHGQRRRGIARRKKTRLPAALPLSSLRTSAGIQAHAY